MESKKGAIITSNYNNAVYLEDCIKSALMQEAPFPIYVILSETILLTILRISVKPIIGIILIELST